MWRALLALIVVAVLAVGGAYVAAGRVAPPQLTITKPDRIVGQSGSLEVTAQAPNARFTALTVSLEQNGRTTPLFALDNAQMATMMTKVDPNRVRIARSIGRQSVPELRSGQARIVVNATRPSFLNLRQVSSTTSKDFQVRLEPHLKIDRKSTRLNSSH